MSVLYVTYEDVLHRSTEEAKRVTDFLGGWMDAATMAAVVESGVEQDQTQTPRRHP